MTDEELKQLFQDTRRHFDVSTESIQREVRTVAVAVAGLDERVRSIAADLRSEMSRGFADTQAMIKFSHAELDKRVRTLEDNQRSLEESVANLQARVERLESTSTH